MTQVEQLMLTIAQQNAINGYTKEMQAQQDPTVAKAELEEAKRAAEEKAKLLDADGDGIITKEEAKAAEAEAAAEAMQKLDEEHEKPHEQAAKASAPVVQLTPTSEFVLDKFRAQHQAVWALFQSIYMAEAENKGKFHKKADQKRRAKDREAKVRADKADKKAAAMANITYEQYKANDPTLLPIKMYPLLT